jgi:hypothetical protein
MLPVTRRLLLATLAACCAAPAFAETLRCQSVNGNVTCAGSGAVSCQTVDGRTTCVSGGGRVVQQFGSAGSSPPVVEPEEPDDREDGPPPRPAGRHLSIERQGPAGRLSLERDGNRLRLRTERLAIDLD